jgi:hypothetical protein
VNFAELGRTVARANAIRFHGHEPHSHDVPHLVYLVSGTGTLTVEGRTVTMRAHQAAWLAADVVHSLELSDDGMALGPFLDETAVPPGGRLRILGPVRELDELFLVLLCVAPESEEERDPFATSRASTSRSPCRSIPSPTPSRWRPPTSTAPSTHSHSGTSRARGTCSACSSRRRDCPSLDGAPGRDSTPRS